MFYVVGLVWPTGKTMLNGTSTIRGTFLRMMKKDPKKSNLKLIFQKNRTEMRKNGKNYFRKSPEGARKYVGSDVRGGTCFPGMLARKSFKFNKS